MNLKLLKKAMKQVLIAADSRDSNFLLNNYDQLECLSIPTVTYLSYFYEDPVADSFYFNFIKTFLFYAFHD